MMIRVLQLSTVCLFALTVILGVMLLLFAADKMAAYSQLIGTVFPLFVAEVIPALIGTPLTEAVRNLTTKKETAKIMCTIAFDGDVANSFKYFIDNFTDSIRDAISSFQKLYKSIFGLRFTGQGAVYNNVRKYFEPDKIKAVKREHELRAQDGYRQSRYFRRTTRSTIAPIKYKSWKGRR